MIFQENKVKVLVTLEKIPIIQAKSHECMKFQKCHFKKCKVAETFPVRFICFRITCLALFGELLVSRLSSLVSLLSSLFSLLSSLFSLLSLLLISQMAPVTSNFESGHRIRFQMHPPLPHHPWPGGTRETFR